MKSVVRYLQHSRDHEAMRTGRRYRAHAARLTAQRARDSAPSGLDFFRVLAEELQKATHSSPPPRDRARHNFAADGLSARGLTGCEP